MQASPSSHTLPNNWPPERGWPLFLAWMGGVVAMQLIDSTVIAAMLHSTGTADIQWKLRIASVSAAIIVHAWQAWLLFQKFPGRFACWALLPIVSLFLPYELKLAQYLALAIPLVEATLLRGVRQRAWAWILASMAGVILTQGAYWFLYSAGGLQMIQSLSEKASRVGAPVVWSAMATGLLMRGIWILTEAIAAAVLAWKMPPLIPTHPKPNVSATTGP